MRNIINYYLHNFIIKKYIDVRTFIIKKYIDVRTFIIKKYIDVRNFIIKNFGVCIIGFKNNDNYIWLSDYTYNYLFNTILRIVPFIIIIFISNYYGYHVIYKYDSIYDITGTNENHILPIILQFEAFNSNNPLKLYDLTDQIKYYNSSLPLHVFCKLNIPSEYDTIKIKYLIRGKTYNKDINIIEYKNNLIYTLI
jgi:hypothetical protein